ncbi:hypothetical protein GN244_ATG08370 [Phytophthora infestans]|uniref:Uncharacterized protein n=1 Tax=Phytophthora infestans TaxID=4787 RepID=A0A833S3D2_PHYIN|nr:hypothetical protein GN244_ATG08370 [Phytophthora infestans]KAF4136094.1 hypothetical protein GN958_ATG14710 [Phytophthora infestans]
MAVTDGRDRPGGRKAVIVVDLAMERTAIGAKVWRVWRTGVSRRLAAYRHWSAAVSDVGRLQGDGRAAGTFAQCMQREGDIGKRRHGVKNNGIVHRGGEATPAETA